MYFQLSSFIASGLQNSKAAYCWVIGGYVRAVVATLVLGFVTVIGTIIIRDTIGGVFWSYSFFSLGGLATLHIAMKAGKFLRRDD